MNLEGCYTALVTPFENGQIQYDVLRKLVERQVASGVSGIVPVGTTGESPTLAFDEHKQVITEVIKSVAGRCQVVAGTGGNSTAEALELTEYAYREGADATLQVTPYYNKPTQEGLYRHFAAIAEVGLPVMLYNIPGRTGIEISLDTVRRLATYDTVVAIKEAAGDTDRVVAIRQSTDIVVLSGDDAMTLPMMAVGASGVVSVASNLVPGDVVAMTSSALNGDFSSALAIHQRLFDLFRTLFIETNPVPIKAAMAMANLINEEYRLPLCPMSNDTRSKLQATLDALDRTADGGASS